MENSKENNAFLYQGFNKGLTVFVHVLLGGEYQIPLVWVEKVIFSKTKHRVKLNFNF